MNDDIENDAIFSTEHNKMNVRSIIESMQRCTTSSDVENSLNVRLDSNATKQLTHS